MILGDCKSVVPDKVLPLPGLLTSAIWIIIVIVLKFIMSKLYLPYAMIYALSIVQLILIIVTVGSLKNVDSVRLLLGVDYTYRNTVKSLLIVSLVFNYIANGFYIFIFIKYIRQLIRNPRQIDYIVNIGILILATITNYRFALVAFSKMFPKPVIYV
jgi:hypothetical protein